MIETWKDVVGYDGAYQVSNVGNVRSMPRYRRRSIINMRVGLSHDGYKQVGLHRDGKMKMEKVHLLVIAAFKGPRPTPEAQCRHLDDDRSNANLSNLEWGTPAENYADRERAGSCRGERNGSAKLTEGDVGSIKRLLSDGVPQAEIARRYGCTPQNIWLIKKGAKWAHVASL